MCIKFNVVNASYERVGGGGSWGVASGGRTGGWCKTKGQQSLLSCLMTVGHHERPPYTFTVKVVRAEKTINNKSHSQRPSVVSGAANDFVAGRPKTCIAIIVHTVCSTTAVHLAALVSLEIWWCPSNTIIHETSNHAPSPHSAGFLVNIIVYKRIVNRTRVIFQGLFRRPGIWYVHLLYVSRRALCVVCARERAYDKNRHISNVYDMVYKYNTINTQYIHNTCVCV